MLYNLALPPPPISKIGPRYERKKEILLLNTNATDPMSFIMQKLFYCHQTLKLTSHLAICYQCPSHVNGGFQWGGASVNILCVGGGPRYLVHVW